MNIVRVICGGVCFLYGIYLYLRSFAVGGAVAGTSAYSTAFALFTLSAVFLWCAVFVIPSSALISRKLTHNGLRVAFLFGVLSGLLGIARFVIIRNTGPSISDQLESSRALFLVSVGGLSILFLVLDLILARRKILPK
jgi:hypothetical protein